MSRYQLYPTPEQELVLREHCAHARFVWNMCVEQESWWRPGRGEMPGWVGRCRQLTEARAAFAWLRAGSAEVQRQAIRDFDQAMKRFFNGVTGRPTWRKAGVREGFRNADYFVARKLSRRWGEVLVPKVGWVRFRWSRPVPPAKSYRVTRDLTGRWHISFAAIPPVIPAPGSGEIVGLDRGVTVSAALSTGELLACPRLSPGRQRRLLRLQRQASRRRIRGRPASARLKRSQASIAQLKAWETSARRDWAEKLSTDLARRFDVIRVEDLKIRNMTRSARGTLDAPGRNVRAKASLNREILASGWGVLVRRLEQKAPGRVEKVNPAFTSQTCSQCKTRDREARESQAVFRCRSCGYCGNADVNAARNIAAGYAVTARGGSQLEPANRELRVA